MDELLWEKAFKTRQVDPAHLETLAKEAGLDMRPRTVIVFGNPKLGTPVMIKTPSLAIDVPPKALVWEDDSGKVFLSYNSAEYLYGTIYPRHGLQAPPPEALARRI